MAAYTYTPAERQFRQRMKVWKDDPRIFVREVFGATPDPWQDIVLAAFPKTPRIALLASKGVGKTTLLAWLIWNFLLTRSNAKIACISIDSNNLRDALWSELALWRSKSQLLQSLFEFTKTKIFSRQQGYEDIWFCSARSWKKNSTKSEQASSLSGLHAGNIMFVADESGAMPDGILASAENALSACQEGHILQAGNPERLEGPLYVASKNDIKLKEGGTWMVVPINGDPDNPNRAPRVPIEWAREQIRLWGGRDNDFVKVNVLGQFPSTSLRALIGVDEVEEAMRRFYRESDVAGQPRILGVDVAGEGMDASAICKRQGLQMFNFLKRRGLDTLQGAAMVAREWDSWGAHACFVDGTGGYGTGWIDQLGVLGKAPISVKFNAKAHRADAYGNKRMEMAWDLVAWIKRGGALPESPELLAALTRTTYSVPENKDVMYLEPKELVRAKLGFSPDEFDAAILTFAEPVSRPGANLGGSRAQSAVTGARGEPYNPFAEMDRMAGMQPSGPHSTYDPFHGR